MKPGVCVVFGGPRESQLDCDFQCIEGSDLKRAQRVFELGPVFFSIEEDLTRWWASRWSSLLARQSARASDGEVILLTKPREPGPLRSI